MQTLQWMYRPIEFMERCRQRYGPIFSIRLGAARNIVVVGDPAYAMDVLSGDPEIYESGQANLPFGDGPRARSPPSRSGHGRP